MLDVAGNDFSFFRRANKARAERLLATNDLRPRLDLNGEMSRDLSAKGLGGPSRTPF